MGRRSMRARTVLVALSLVAARSGGRAFAQEPAMFREDPAHSGVRETGGLAGYGGILWRAQTDGPVRSTPAVTGETVFIGSADGRLYALDRRSGRERWRFDAATAVNGSPAVVDGTVYFTDQGSTLYAVEAASGRPRWRVEAGADMAFPWGYESGDLYASSPTVVGRTVYFGAGDGKVYAVRMSDGAVLWSSQTGGRIRSTPAVADEKVFVGSADGIVYALDAEDGSEVWSHATEGAELASGEFGFDRRTVQSSPAVAGGTVFVGARDGFLYALDAATGERRWRFDHEVSWVNSSPAVARGLVFAGTSDGQFIQAVDATSGAERWRVTSAGIVWTSPLVVGDELYVAEGAGRIRALDAGSGEERWSAWVGGRVFGSPVVDDRVLFVGSEDGGVYALRGAHGRSLRRAVFWDSTQVAGAWYTGHEELKSWLAARGYEVLDAGALERFLRARLDDGEPASVVFALDRLPDPVAHGGAESLFRRWLDVGGTAVWLGFAPLIWRRSPEDGRTEGGLLAVDRAATAALLDVSHEAANFDLLGARPTAAGRDLGLPSRWLTSWSVDAAPGLEVLARDENGRAAAWRKSYGGPPGTGFVRIWGSRGPIPAPEAVLTVAEIRPE